MKKTRKLLAIAMVMCTLLCVCAFENPAYATDCTVTATPGQQVKFSVSLNSPATLAGFKIFLDYDTTTLELVSNDGEYAVQKGNFTESGTIMANATATGCQVLWYHTSDVTASGMLFTVTLNVSQQAESKTYPITVRVSADDTVKIDGSAVTLDCTGGSITVADSQAAKIAVASATAEVGDTFTLPVTIKDNPGFSGFSINVSASPQLTLTKISKGALLKADDEGSYYTNVSANTGSVHWSAAKTVTGDGELLVLEFSTSPDCTPGSYSVQLSLSGTTDKDFVNLTPEAIPVIFTAGTVQLNDYTLGDVDNDGAVTASDAVCMAKHIVGLETLTGKAFCAADIDGDKYISAADAVQVAKYIAGMITTFK